MIYYFSLTSVPFLEMLSLTYRTLRPLYKYDSLSDISIYHFSPPFYGLYVTNQTLNFTYESLWKS